MSETQPIQKFTWGNDRDPVERSQRDQVSPIPTHDAICTTGQRAFENPVVCVVGRYDLNVHPRSHGSCDTSDLAPHLQRLIV